jgi:hypothetical protein
LVPAMMAARPAALKRLLPFPGGRPTLPLVPLIPAQRARCAAAMRALAAGDLLYLPRPDGRPSGGTGAASPPVMASSWACRLSICSLIEMISLNCPVVRLFISVIG